MVGLDFTHHTTEEPRNAPSKRATRCRQSVVLRSLTNASESHFGAAGLAGTLEILARGVFFGGFWVTYERLSVGSQNLSFLLD